MTLAEAKTLTTGSVVMLMLMSTTPNHEKTNTFPCVVKEVKNVKGDNKRVHIRVLPLDGKEWEYVDVYRKHEPDGSCWYTHYKFKILKRNGYKVKVRKVTRGA